MTDPLKPLDPTCEHGEWFMEFDSSGAANDDDFDNMGYRKTCGRCYGTDEALKDADQTIALEQAGLK